MPQLQVPRQSSAGSRCGTQLPPKPDFPYPYGYRPDQGYVPPNGTLTQLFQNNKKAARGWTANKTPSNVRLRVHKLENPDFTYGFYYKILLFMLHGTPCK